MASTMGVTLLTKGTKLWVVLTNVYGILYGWHIQTAILLVLFLCDVNGSASGKLLVFMVEQLLYSYWVSAA